MVAGCGTRRPRRGRRQALDHFSTWRAVGRLDCRCAFRSASGRPRLAAVCNARAIAFCEQRLTVARVGLGPGGHPAGCVRLHICRGIGFCRRPHLLVRPERIADLNPTTEVLVHRGLNAAYSLAPEFVQVCHHRPATLAQRRCQAAMLSAQLSRSAVRIQAEMDIHLNAPSDSNASPRATSRPAANQPLGCFSLGGGSFIAANSGEESLRATDSRHLSASRRRVPRKPA